MDCITTLIGTFQVERLCTSEMKSSNLLYRSNQVKNLEILDSHAEQNLRSDQRDSNLWESERLEMARAREGRHSGSSGSQDATDREQESRTKSTDDEWWSAESEGSPSFTGNAAVGREAEAKWWQEDGGAGKGGGYGGIEPDSLPSFFDN